MVETLKTAETLLTPAFVRAMPDEPAYKDRLKQEFALIDQNRFTKVFLQVQVILSLCRTLDIPHILRGSAGSSLVCYLMGISHTDPLKYGMEVARFMNQGRTDMPDIDMDVPYNRRDELYAAIGKQWPGQVARISNHVRFKYKSALQAAMKKHAPLIPYRKGVKLDTLVKDPELAAVIQRTLYESLGTVRTESLHCGGIVIFDGPVPPFLLLKNDGILPQIKLDKDETEDAGLIKIDVLSNRGMAQWREASGGARPLLEYPETYDAIARLFAEGRTIGITFGESRGQRAIYRKLQPKNIPDIAIALALIRPAAASGGRKSEYLMTPASARKSGDLHRPIIFDDDALARIRAVYQYRNPKALSRERLDSLADRVRKAFAKQKTKECDEFERLCEKIGIPEDVLTKLFDDLHQLQHYSFCKSHALSYAQLVWALAYEKIHHTHAFWVATLNHCQSDYRTWVHWREALLSGLLLTRGPPPYTLGKTATGAPIIKSSKLEQRLLIPDEHPSQILLDYKARGYWCAQEFIPGCYLRISPVKQRTLTTKKQTLVMAKPEYCVEFCGLIATGRVVHRDTDGEESADNGQSTVTMMCIGVENGSYIDLIVHGDRGALLGYVAVAGTAVTKQSEITESLEVKTIRGVSLRMLMESSERTRIF